MRVVRSINHNAAIGIDSLGREAVVLDAGVGEVTTEERLYLMMHINRLVERAAGYVAAGDPLTYVVA